MKMAMQSVTLVFAAADTVKTFTVSQNGYLTDFSMTIPNFTTAASLVVTINDKDSRLWYTSASINDNQSINTHPTNRIPVDIGWVVTVTLNAASGGAHNILMGLAVEVK